MSYTKATLITVEKGTDGQRERLRDSGNPLIRAAIVEFGNKGDRCHYLTNGEESYQVLGAIAEYGDNDDRQVLLEKYNNDDVDELIHGQEIVLGEIARFGTPDQRESLIDCYSAHVRAIVAICGTPVQHDILVYDENMSVLLNVIEFSKGQHHLELLDHPYPAVKEAALKKQAKK